MAKQQPKAKITTEVVWEYEYVIREKGQQPETIWIPEDDERSASYKALRDGATGNIRSRTETVQRQKREDDVLLEVTEWQVKAQSLLPPK